MSVFIGIDLGTSATKAIAVGQDGEVIARARCSHPGSRSAGAGREDPRAWTESIRRACSDLGPALAGAVGVGIDVHCPVAVPMDDRGRACGLAVAWDNDVLNYYFNKYSGRRTERAVAATGNHASQSTFLAVAAEGIEDLLWIDRGRAFSGERGMPRRGAPDAPGPG